MTVILGAVCGGTAVAAGSASAEAARDACALVTPAQVSAAAGAQVGAGGRIGTTGCQWSTPGAAGSTGHLVITISIWDAKQFPKSATPGVTLKPASGMGDAAVFGTLGDLTSLFVKKGTSTLMFRVYGLQHDAARQEAIESAIARDALARW